MKKKLSLKFKLNSYRMPLVIFEKVIMYSIVILSLYFAFINKVLTVENFIRALGLPFISFLWIFSYFFLFAPIIVPAYIIYRLSSDSNKISHESIIFSIYTILSIVWWIIIIIYGKEIVRKLPGF